MNTCILIFLSLLCLNHSFAEFTTIRKRSNTSGLSLMITLLSKTFDQLHKSNTELQKMMQKSRQTEYENKEKISRLQQKMQSVMKTASENNKETKTMKIRVQKMVDESGKTEYENKEKILRLQHKMQSVMKKANANKKETKKLKIRVGQMQSKVTELQKGVNDLKVKGKGPAFTALLKSNKKLYPGRILKFDRVLLNRNNGYDPNTGYYTVPWPGLYQASCTVRPWYGNVHVHLWKNDHIIALGFGGHWKTGSLQLALHLRKGDKLSIRNSPASFVKNEQIQGGAASMFSVVYLSE